PSGSLIEIAFVSALTAGMIAGGALALYPVPLAALIFTSLLSLMALPSVFIGLDGQTVPFLIIMAAFICVVIYSIRRHTGMFLSELGGKLEAERQRDMVRLLMGTYQGEGGHCVWQSDDLFNLTTDPGPVVQMFGLEQESGVPGNLARLVQGSAARAYDPGDAEALARILNQGRSRESTFDITFVTAAEQVFRLVGRSASAAPNALPGYHGYLKDITGEVRANENVYRLATRDTLTDLLNYPEFMRRGRALLEGVEPEVPAPISLFLFIDADNLKTINDTYGHAIGDHLIATIAGRLTTLLPKRCLICRKGGDEFLALTTCRSEEEAGMIAQAALSDLMGGFTIEKRDLPLSCCIGASINHGRKTSLERMELEADRALYHAKSQGKRQLKIYDAEIGAAIGRTRVLAHDLVLALARRELHLAFQPIVRAEDGGILGAEALLRWTHPEFGMISPEEILTLAKREGKSAAVSQFVLRKAVATAKSWPDEIFVSVNFSAADLRHRNL
ncbi:MAG: diguanylate cyclase, partial [Henriciella sp.]|uniref:diguanylate cyclase domain-containing protein n=1 Tax=Henriciella sp. TaxID=1968823 RepID=UPI003C77EEAA